MDNMYDASIIPTLYGKIGVLTVRMDILTAENARLLEMLSEAKKPEPPDAITDK